MENSISLSEEKKNSIVLKKSAKCYNWDIKVYFNDDKDKAVTLLNEINIALKAKYEG